MATIMAIILVFTLSIRLRQREIETIFKLGCSRMTIVKLMVAEIFIIISASAALCALLMIFANYSANDLVRMLFIR